MLFFRNIIILGAGSVAVVNAAVCGRYVVESAGKDISFSNYIFQDFRNIASKVSGNSAASEKRDISLQQFFTEKSISRLWQKQSWSRPASPVPMFNVLDNVFIDFDATTSTGNDTMLSLTTARKPDGTQEAGEIASAFKAHYASIRFSARVTGDPGACAGLFFYADDTNESDFEFLTKDGDGSVHVTNQPGNIRGQPVPGATNKLSLLKSSTQWNTYRLDWTPGMTRYFINGKIVSNKTTNVSEEPMAWLMNLWSDGSSWPGIMQRGDSARMDVRWVQMAFNQPSVSNTDGDISCRLQPEMEGQGLVVSLGQEGSSGGSLVARGAALVSAAVAGRVVGEAMR